MGSKVKKLFLAICLSASMVSMSFGQRTTATFTGVVTDPSGAVLPGADVQLINEGTSAAMQQLTTETGEFIFNYVPVGTYTLKIGMPGFKSYDSRSIPLGAAQNVRRTYKLEIGAVTDSVTVTGEAPLVNAISPEQRINLDTLEVKDLPMVNRNITNILSVGTGLTRGDMIEGTRATRFRLNGLGGSATSVTADGTDANGNSGSPSISGYYGYNKIDVMSSESVSEVQIVKGVIPAEYGSAMGGNMSLITKSGTNEYHGSLFHRYEGSALSARPQFLRTVPNSVWNQFGGSLGGPIKRNKVFFFAAYEGYRQRTSVPLNANVPTPAFRNMILAALPFRETQMNLDYYPLPTQPYAPTDLTGVFIGPAPKRADDDHLDTKIDVLLGKGSLSLTHNWGHPSNSIPVALPADPRVFTSRSRRVSASYVIGWGRWTSSTRAGYNKNELHRIDQMWYLVDPNKAESVPGWRRVQGIAYPGMTVPGRENHTRGIVPGYSFEQQFALVRGAHSYKFGGIFSSPAGGRPDSNANQLTYNTLQALNTNTPDSITFQSGTNEFTWRFMNFGFFGQDDWRVNRKLVLNLGVRYDRYGHYVAKPRDPNRPAGLFNLDGLRSANFDFGPLRDPGNPINSDNLSLAPRFGFAYTADSQGNMVVRGGFGVNFQGFDPQTYETNTGITPSIPNSRTFSRADALARGFKFPVYEEEIVKTIQAEATAANPQVGALFDPNTKPPYAMNFTLGIERAITPALALETAFVGTRGVKFTLTRTYNQLDRVTGIRPNPNLGEANYNDSSQQTSYFSWQSTLKQRMTHNLLFSMHYTWGKAMAYTGGDISQSFNGDTFGGIEDFFNVKIEHSPAAGDVTHSFVSNWVYTVPTLVGKSAVGRQLLGGWQVSGIWKAQTGTPFRVTQTGGRPDLVDFNGAINHDCCGFGNLQYLNKAAFQAVPVGALSARTVRRGSMGNNPLRNPGFNSLDFSLGKNFGVGEKRSLELKADLLNALNQTIYSGFSTNFNASNFGQATSTGGARVIQVQLRLGF